MSTADSILIGIKLQAVGENLNTWGDPNLNNALSVLARSVHGWQNITITTDYTISDTQYGTSNESEVATLKLNGSPAAAFNLNLPSRQRTLVIWNNTGQTCTAKHSASTGFAIPAGATVIAASDGSEVYNRTPTFVGTSFVPTHLGHLTNKQYVDNLVSNSTIPAATGALLVSGGDSSASYLQGAINPTGELRSSIQNAGADETLELYAVPHWSTAYVASVGASTIQAFDRDDILFESSVGIGLIKFPLTGRIRVTDIDGRAAANNATLIPQGADTTTFDTIDTNYFSGIWQRRPGGTNWDLI